MRNVWLGLVWVWCLTFTVATHATPPRPDIHVFPAELVRVVDGDTMDVVVELPQGLEWSLRLRIRHLDTPETWRPSTTQEAAHGTAATIRAIQLLQEPFWVRLGDVAIYGRSEADIILHNLHDYARTMRDSGFEKRDHYKDAQ